MKRELYQFYPEVYPFNLWIYVGKDVSGMVECFNNDFSEKKYLCDEREEKKYLCDEREGVPITNLPPPKRVFSPTPPSLENRKRVLPQT
jgi:hypothetical protein